MIVSLNEKINYHRIKWKEYVEIMNKESLLRKALLYKLKRKRELGNQEKGELIHKTGIVKQKKRKF